MTYESHFVRHQAQSRIFFFSLSLGQLLSLSLLILRLRYLELFYKSCSQFRSIPKFSLGSCAQFSLILGVSSLFSYNARVHIGFSQTFGFRMMSTVNASLGSFSILDSFQFPVISQVRQSITLLFTIGQYEVI